MKLIFGTTSKRKVEDLQNIINEMNLNIQVLSMKDINWDRGEIDEDGLTLEENSLIKAQAILSYGEIKPPFFYSVFVLEGTNVAFNELKGHDLDNTYRYSALRKALRKIERDYL